MKNRVKGLLALCLAMCMVLAMTTVAFGAETFYGDLAGTWTPANPGDKITTYRDEYYNMFFFVVDENGNYWAEMNTEANGAHGTAYTDASDSASAVPYFTNARSVDSSEKSYDIFTLPTMAGYSYEVTKSNGSGLQLYKINGNEREPISNRLMVKLVAKDGFTVKYDLNGGTGSIADKTVKWTDTVLPGSEPTWDGRTFAGWKYGDTMVTESTTYGDLAITELSSITLVAQWEGSSGHETIRRQHVVAVEEPVTEPETESTTVDSPKTFDAGVAVYGAMAALSLTGTAAIIGKKRKS